MRRENRPQQFARIRPRIPKPPREQSPFAFPTQLARSGLGGAAEAAADAFPHQLEGRADQRQVHLQLHQAGGNARTAAAGEVPEAQPEPFVRPDLQHAQQHQVRPRPHEQIQQEPQEIGDVIRRAGRIERYRKRPAEADRRRQRIQHKRCLGEHVLALAQQLQRSEQDKFPERIGRRRCEQHPPAPSHQFERSEPHTRHAVNVDELRHCL